MFEIDAGGRFVDLLASCARRADKSFFEVFLPDPEALHLLDPGAHRGDGHQAIGVALHDDHWHLRNRAQLIGAARGRRIGRSERRPEVGVLDAEDFVRRPFVRVREVRDVVVAGHLPTL